MNTEISSKLCNLCRDQQGKYTCPRCNINYCSTTCYQSSKHVECAEVFYKSCVMDELACSNSTDDSQQKMQEIFNRMKDCKLDDGPESDLDSDDDAEYVDLSERLADVNLDDCNKVWEKLTQDERQEFEAFLRSEDITEFVPRWEPWWLRRFDGKVEDVNEIEQHKESCPKVRDNITPFEKITKKTPDKSVKFNLANVVAAYAFVTRYFNGCQTEFLNEAVNSIVLVSLSLRESANFSSLELAVDSVHQECIKSEWITIDEENIKLMQEDTRMILEGPQECDKKFYTLCMLSELENLMNDQLKVKSKGDNLFLPPKQQVARKSVKLALKKVEYFLSYVHSCY